MKILSLFWHSVDPDSINPDYIDGSNPTQSLFREQLKYITDNFTPISIVDFINIAEDRQRMRSYAKPPVLLGFDDGFTNVINQALPILYEFKVPALFFVIGEILKNSDYVPWYVEIKHLFRKTVKKSITFNNKIFNLVSKQDQALLKYNLNTSFKNCKSEIDRQGFMNNLSSILDVERPVASDLDEDLCFVNKEDLINLGPGSLLTVSSHAMTHNLLANLTRQEQIYELEQSDILLSKFAPSYYPVISYPNGSFNKDTIDIAKRLYKFAFAVLIGSSYRNYYAYRRINLQNQNVQELKHKISFKRMNLLLPIKLILHNIGIRRMAN